MLIPGLSLCMIVKNEAQHLEKCLLSVQGLVSEIIIADTGSSDESIDIARRFGARIIELPWEHDFSKARNLTLRLASCTWILVLDADEALTDWRPEEVERLLETQSADGYFLPFIHYVGEFSEGDYVTDNVCRLFRNDERILFRGSIHEEVASSIWSLPGGNIAYTALPVHHYGYLDGELQRKHKTSRNLELIHSALKLEPHSIHLRYALGTEHYQQGNYNAAAEVFLPLLEEVPADSGYTADLYLKTAFALEAGGRPEEAQSVYEAGSILYPDFTDLLESYAGLLLEQGELWLAYDLLQRALDSGDTAYKYPSSSGSGTSRTRLFTGQVCERLFLYEEALDHYRQALGYTPDYSAAWEQLAPLCLLSGQEEQLTAITRQLLPALPQRVLGRLVPAALNARAAEWLAALSAAPHLPEAIRQVLQVLLGTLFRDPEQPSTASVRLERMLRDEPDQPWISGYLWALSCRSGGPAAAGQWLERLARNRPGIAAMHRWLAQQNGGAPAHLAEREPDAERPADQPADGAGTDRRFKGTVRHPDSSNSALPQRTAEDYTDSSVPPPGSSSHPELSADTPLRFPDISYTAQLLVQAGAWDTLLLLFSPMAASRFQWSRLPQPLLHGLLQAPVPVKEQWCAMYTGQAHFYSSPGDAAEWLLYAAIADSCGLIPRLDPADEQALRQSGGTAAAVGLSYCQLLLAAGVHPQGMPVVSGSIPWLLLARSALQAE
ncbi:glycosyltransferase [Paenibacillus borealis]|uniref:glycosyltransferase n=1 Tax=Paenibacillus borealis TaxID=160799 RepID=UPI0006932C80|nr:glycosyltransferase [Paenibacillus borealis]